MANSNFFKYEYTSVNKNIAKELYDNKKIVILQNPLYSLDNALCEPLCVLNDTHGSDFDSVVEKFLIMKNTQSVAYYVKIKDLLERIPNDKN